MAKSKNKSAQKTTAKSRVKRLLGRSNSNPVLISNLKTGKERKEVIKAAILEGLLIYLRFSRTFHKSFL